ncbi:hypothetical protein [Croceibacterium ferulae]|uniref:hypothetical protein n=1 Tax=Croceibacterium ferulae TaxID=1854641 RepID=UPI000EB5A9B3|nr:hypothetical protein [Croceibacterium ferulae]
MTNPPALSAALSYTLCISKQHRERMILEMNLYEAEMVTENGSEQINVVAPSHERSIDFIREYYRQTGVRVTKIVTRRIDTELKGRDRLRLDDLLHTAPICFAAYCPPIGWLADQTATLPLRLFKIEVSGKLADFVVAPNTDVASAVWAASLMPFEGEVRQFNILDGALGLTEHQRKCLSSVLGFGPAGIATWDGEEGWTVRSPG